MEQPEQTIETVEVEESPYNSTYPLSPTETSCAVKFRIAVITDLDKSSKVQDEENTWVSYLKRGYLTWNSAAKSVVIEWDEAEPVKLKSNLHRGGRGMELSELLVFNGKLLAPDDRTGVIYQINPDSGIIDAWVTLVDGDGTSGQGFKCEWATVKDRKLYVGSHGYGHDEEAKKRLMWVKTVTTKGEIEHFDWDKQYSAMSSALEVASPGYVTHEAALWSDTRQRWFFLPRRVSKEAFDDVADETKGSNVLLTVDQDFTKVEVSHIGETFDPTRGFSSFKFVPGTGDTVAVALKTIETKDSASTFIMAFDMDGTVLMPETKIADLKYEGFEFI